MCGNQSTFALNGPQIVKWFAGTAPVKPNDVQWISGAEFKRAFPSEARGFNYDLLKLTPIVDNRNYAIGAIGSSVRPITRRVIFVDTDKPTKCGAMCRNAKGPMCDCSCKGDNHGAGVTMSRTRFAERVNPINNPRFSAHNIQLPKGKRRLNIDQATAALQQMGYRLGNIRFDPKVGGSVYKVTLPNGSVVDIAAADLTNFIYEKAKNMKTGSKATMANELFRVRIGNGTVSSAEFMEYARRFVPNVSRNDFLPAIVEKVNAALAARGDSIRVSILMKGQDFSRSGAKATMAKREYVLWALPKGETDRMHEKPIAYNITKPADMERIKVEATKRGYHSFRVQVIEWARSGAKAAFNAAVGTAWNKFKTGDWVDVIRNGVAAGYGQVVYLTRDHMTITVGSAFSSTGTMDVMPTDTVKLVRRPTPDEIKRSGVRLYNSLLPEKIVHTFGDGWEVVEKHDGWTGGTKLVLRRRPAQGYQATIVKSIAEAKQQHDIITNWIFRATVKEDKPNEWFIHATPADGGWSIGNRGGEPFKTRAAAQQALEKRQAAQRKKAGMSRFSAKAAFDAFDPFTAPAKPASWDGKRIKLNDKMYKVEPNGGAYDLYDMNTNKKTKTMTAEQLYRAWEQGRIKTIYNRSGAKAAFDKNTIVESWTSPKGTRYESGLWQSHGGTYQPYVTATYSDGGEQLMTLNEKSYATESGARKRLAAVVSRMKSNYSRVGAKAAFAEPQSFRDLVAYARFHFNLNLYQAQDVAGRAGIFLTMHPNKYPFEMVMQEALKRSNSALTAEQKSPDYRVGSNIKGNPTMRDSSLVMSRHGAKGQFDLRAKVQQMKSMVSKLATTLGFKPDEVTGNDQMMHILFENQPKQADRLAAALRTNLARVGVPASAITTHEHHYADENTTYGGVWIDLNAVANASGKMSRFGAKTKFGATHAEVHRTAKSWLAKVNRTQPPEGLEQFHTRLKTRLAEIVRDTGEMLRNPEMIDDYGGWSDDDLMREVRKVGGNSNVANRWLAVNLGGTSLGGFSRSGAKAGFAEELIQKLSGGWEIVKIDGILHLAKGNEAIPVPSVQRAMELHKASTEGRLMKQNVAGTKTKSFSRVGEAEAFELGAASESDDPTKDENLIALANRVGREHTVNLFKCWSEGKASMGYAP